MHQYLDSSCETLSPYQLMNGHPVYDIFLRHQWDSHIRPEGICAYLYNVYVPV